MTCPHDQSLDPTGSEITRAVFADDCDVNYLSYKLKNVQISSYGFHAPPAGEPQAAMPEGTQGRPARAVALGRMFEECYVDVSADGFASPLDALAVQLVKERNGDSESGSTPALLLPAVQGVAHHSCGQLPPDRTGDADAPGFSQPSNAPRVIPPRIILDDYLPPQDWVMPF